MQCCWSGFLIPDPAPEFLNYLYEKNRSILSPTSIAKYFIFLLKKEINVLLVMSYFRSELEGLNAWLRPEMEGDATDARSSVSPGLSPGSPFSWSLIMFSRLILGDLSIVAMIRRRSCGRVVTSRTQVPVHKKVREYQFLSITLH